jgi:very-short-patch-repair endonuclease
MKKPSFQTANARRLRRDMTPAEAKLWGILRDRRIGQFKFRRQQPVGPFYVDFVCFAARVVVELDGTSHLGREEHDSARECYLRESGFVIIRFENFVVMLDENRVVEAVVRVCRKRAGDPLTPIPSPAGGEGGQTHPEPLTPLPQGERGNNSWPRP